MLLFNSAAHFFVDAVCAATLFGSGASDMTALLLLYNTAAFSTQCLVGLALDKLGHQRAYAAAACFIVAMGFILPLPHMWRAGIVAIGNSVFHVAGGTQVLRGSNGKATPLGLFVAPGSVGLILGTLYPNLGKTFALLLAACAGGMLNREYAHKADDSIAAPAPAAKGGGAYAGVLLLAVAARAIGGTAVSFPWKTTELLSIVTVLFVFAGKASGGFICDLLGAKKTALLSIPAAALLIAFFSWSMPLSLLGQFMLNVTMPVTLLLIYKALPDSPGFAFGLAASVLWPGTIIGQLISITGPALRICVILSFAAGLAAIIWTTRGEKYEKV